MSDISLEKIEALGLLQRSLDVLRRTINGCYNNPELVVQAHILSDDIKSYLKKVRDNG